MEERLKEIRKTLNLSQKDFAKALGIGQSTWAMIEVGKRELKDRHIKLICTIFSINEQWLRTGEGSMYADDTFEAQAIIDSVMSSEDEFAKSVLVAFAKMSKEDWLVIKRIVDNIKKSDD